MLCHLLLNNSNSRKTICPSLELKVSLNYIPKSGNICSLLRYFLRCLKQPTFTSRRTATRHQKSLLHSLILEPRHRHYSAIKINAHSSQFLSFENFNLVQVLQFLSIRLGQTTDQARSKQTAIDFLRLNCLLLLLLLFWRFCLGKKELEL